MSPFSFGSAVSARAIAPEADSLHGSGSQTVCRYGLCRREPGLDTVGRAGTMNSGSPVVGEEEEVWASAIVTDATMNVIRPAPSLIPGG